MMYIMSFILIFAVVYTIWYIILKIANFICETKYDIVEYASLDVSFYKIEYYGIKCMKRSLSRDDRIVGYMNRNRGVNIRVGSTSKTANDKDGHAAFSSQHDAKIYLIYRKKFLDNKKGKTRIAATFSDSDISAASMIDDAHS